jgi:protocatechuate 3,4-dioxygenase alpha subunit
MTTPSQTVGPFFAIGLDRLDAGSGDVHIAGTVFDGAGDPVPDSMVEIWHPEPPQFARALADAEGRFEVSVEKPRAVAGHAPHFAVSVFARGLLKRVVTRIYFPDEADANAADPVLALIDDARERESLVAIDEGDRLRFDVHLHGESQTAFFEL